MKPAGPVARRADYEIARCGVSEASPIVREHHYSRSTSNTGIWYCARRGDKVRAVVGFLPAMPASSAYIARMADERDMVVDPQRVLALHRLVWWINCDCKDAS